MDHIHTFVEGYSTNGNINIRGRRNNYNIPPFGWISNSFFCPDYAFSIITITATDGTESMFGTFVHYKLG